MAAEPERAEDGRKWQQEEEKTGGQEDISIAQEKEPKQLAMDQPASMANDPDWHSNHRELDDNKHPGGRDGNLFEPTGGTDKQAIIPLAANVGKDEFANEKTASNLDSYDPFANVGKNKKVLNLPTLAKNLKDF